MKLTRIKKIERFLTKLPKGKYVTSGFISRKYGYGKGQAVYDLVTVAKRIGLKTKLLYEKTTSGNQLVRAYYK